MSLADLHSSVAASLPTLRKAVQSLVDAHWIRTVGQAEANGGRPAMLFGIDDSHFAILGVHLQLPGIHLALVDLRGNVLDDAEMYDGVLPTPNECVQTVTEYVVRIRNAFPSRQLVGIGIATPGFIDLTSGDIISIGRVPSWTNFPICRQLQAVLNLPVHIANDVDCLAIAELRHSHPSNESNLAYIGFDEGVKISLFLRGTLYKGAFGNAGLIAPSLLAVSDLSNPKEIPYLVTINGLTRLFEEHLIQLDTAEQMLYADIVSAASPRERVQRILANARPERPVCYSLVQDQSKVLAGIAASMILIVQPDTVVIGGLQSLMPQELFSKLELGIRQYLPPLINNNILIRQGKLALQNSGAIGASYHFLQTYLSENASELA
jgi:predicted NBD/HSP70 family sugar kinase